MAKFLIAIILWLSVTVSYAEELDPAIVQLQHDWATANYNTPKSSQELAFKNLTDRAAEIVNKSPQRAEALIWHAIVLSGYAKAVGGITAGITALKAVDKSKDMLLESINLDPQALHGSAYVSLGSLYYKVPPWPISFGNKDKAKEYLEKGLSVNPNGIDANYFYADFCLETGNYDKAVKFFEKALNAPPRAGREDADEGRRKEAKEGLALAKKKLAEK
jgi:tetratricopeptide (TPR) repeat protein